MAGISTVLNIGTQALQASQVGIQVTGQNIANVNTEGYSRQRVLFEDNPYIDSTPGQLGMGVNASEIQRMFDSFLEQAYNTKASARERYGTLADNLAAVENIFNESSAGGISASLTKFFQDWENLSTDPGSYPQRQNLLSDTRSFIAILQQASADLDTIQKQADDNITQNVEEVNNLLDGIVSLNKEIALHNNPPSQNANGLLDARTTKIRRLAELMDVNVIDHGGGNIIISTQAGQTLVDGMYRYDLKLESNKVVRNLVPGTQFDGTVNFSGTDDFEYTIKVVQAGNVSSGAGAAEYQVSLDGGVTWLRSDSGAIKTFSARPPGLSVSVGNLGISFGQLSNSSLSPTGTLAVGDVFTVVPKKALYWYQSAAAPINITPQVTFTGQDNPNRVTGGELAGNFILRDYDIGRYKARLDSLVKGVIWETNRIHSQGAGLKMFSEVTGTYQVTSPNLALGSGTSGLAFADKLASGASMMAVYDTTTGALVSNSYLDFDSSTAGLQLFDPSKHSLNDVVAAINHTFGNYLTATVTNNTLQVTAKNGYTFGFGTDATGLFAALGVNTFFDGDNAGNMALNPRAGADSGLINAGHINGAGEANVGDNSTALAMAALRTKEVTLSTTFDAPTQQTLGAYYSSLVGVVGVDAENANFSYKFEKTLADNLNAQQLAVSGVNLDEEMSNLIKFQHSYQAAAKMISTADQMMQIVLGLKQ